MNINQLKDECNGLFERAINMLEKYADPNEICKLLLEAASLLVEIGKFNGIRKDIHARRFFDIHFILRIRLFKFIFQLN